MSDWARRTQWARHPVLPRVAVLEAPNSRSQSVASLDRASFAPCGFDERTAEPRTNEARNERAQPRVDGRRASSADQNNARSTTNDDRMPDQAIRSAIILPPFAP